MRYLILFVFYFFSFNSHLFSQKLVGVSGGGGANQKGSIYQYDVADSSFSVLHSFDSSCTSWFIAPSLIEGKNGKLYGVESGCNGYIYELDVNTANYKRLIHFDTTQMGGWLSEFLYTYSDHEIIGATANGGDHGKGVVFKYNYLDGSLDKIYDFDSLEFPPYKGLTHYKDQIYIGTSAGGGTYNDGTMFKLDLSNDSYEILLHFNDSTLGGAPYAVPYITSDNIAFTITHGGWDAPTLYNGAPTVVGYDLIGDSLKTFQIYEPAFYGRRAHSQFIEFDSILYSVSSFNRARIITYRLDGNNTFTNEGYVPDSLGPPDDLMLASNTLFYSATEYRGENGRGVLLSYDPITKIWNNLHDFTFAEADLGKGKLIELSDCAGVNRTINYSGNGLSSAETGATYQWIELNSDSLLLNATQQYFQPNDTGRYAVIIQKGSCVDTSNSIRIIAVGIEDQMGPSQIRIYPNPSNGIVNLKRSTSDVLQMQLFNLQGQLIKQELLLPSTNQIQLPEASGLYFITLTDESGREANFKLIRE